MKLALYKELERQYDIKRQKAIREAQLKREEVLKILPKYAELEEKKNAVAIEHAKSMVKERGITKQVAEENMEIKLKEIEKEIEQLFRSNGYNKNHLEPIYECDKCEDTGVIKIGDRETRCICYKQKIINITYKQNNMLKLEEENFNTFDTCYFSNAVNKSKYESDKAPLDNIEEIKKIALSFCKNIADYKQRNLLFVGKAGTGKTFMSSCIANEAIEQGHTVLYQTAPILMDMMLEAKFSTQKDSLQKEQYDKVFDVDLLIIDDLGTETLNNMKFTELFNIINTRLLKNKKTIISTNLALSELAAEYDDRVMSRLIGNYTVCKFFGDDIRLKKKKICCD